MKYLNALNKIEGIGSQKMRLLLNFFGTAEVAWKADLSALEESKIGGSVAEKFLSTRRDIDPDMEWEKMEKENIRMIIWDSPEYPKLLREIPRPPYLIYIKGNLDLNSAPMVSVVGSRKYTAYGAQAADSLARDLAHAGIIVVSGLAMGIDAIAHRGALGAGGQTVAVLGDSLDDKNIYPRVNFNLAHEIMNQGLILSEYPIETSAGVPGNFPARNRIIAGLSLGTLIVEAGIGSGSLITANQALEFNREIFAIPGSIFSAQSIGTNDLLKKGAKIVTGIKDILEELNLEELDKKNNALAKIPENKEEEILLKILSADPVHIDNISKISKLGTATVLSTLSMLELKGWAKNIGGQNYIIL